MVFLIAPFKGERRSLEIDSVENNDQIPIKTTDIRNTKCAVLRRLWELKGKLDVSFITS